MQFPARTIFFSFTDPKHFQGEGLDIGINIIRKIRTQLILQRFFLFSANILNSSTSQQTTSFSLDTAECNILHVCLQLLEMTNGGESDWKKAKFLFTEPLQP